MATNSPQSIQERIVSLRKRLQPHFISASKGSQQLLQMGLGWLALNVIHIANWISRRPLRKIEPFLRSSPNLIFVSQLSWRYFLLRFFTWQLGILFILIAVPYTIEGFTIAIKLLDVERIFRTKLFSPENLTWIEGMVTQILLWVWCIQLILDLWFRWMSGWFCLQLSGRNLYFGIVESSLLRTRSRYIHSSSPQVGFYQSTQNWLQRLYHIQDVQLTLDGKGFRISQTPNGGLLRKMLYRYL